MWPSRRSREEVAQWGWWAQGPKSSSQRGRFPAQRNHADRNHGGSKALRHTSPDAQGVGVVRPRRAVSPLRSPPLPRLPVEGAHSESPQEKCTPIRPQVRV